MVGLDSIKAEILSQQEAADRHLRCVRQLTEYLQTVCKHKNTHINKKYVSATYYDSDYEIGSKICIDCNKTLNTWIE